MIHKEPAVMGAGDGWGLADGSGAVGHPEKLGGFEAGNVIPSC